jgi:hypothetical protein
MASKTVHKPAKNEILDQGAIAMEQHYARPGRIATLEVVKPHTFTLDELAYRRVLPFSREREHDVPGYDNENNAKNDKEDFSRVHC